MRAVLLPAPVLVMALLSTAHADVAPFPLAAGSNPRVLKQKSVDVVMVREDVTVTLFDAFAVVDATFVMRNEGKEQEMEVGFPGQGVMHGQNYSAHQELHGFTAWVDDVAVKSKASDVEERVPAGPKGFRMRKETWHGFAVKFPTGKPVKIRVRYGVVVEEH